MNIIWLCIPAVLSVTSAFPVQMIENRRIRVFPADNPSVAGVLQVSSLNQQNQSQYAFNATEARRLCLSLGLTLASKAQVEKALSRGLETCRFGWIDEHFAVIPRIQPLASCGQNKTGLVPWRASVDKKFDVFCFNESDAARKLWDTITESPLSSTYVLSHTHSTSTVHATSSSSTHKTLDNELQPAHSVSSSQGFTGGKAILIICTCALLLIIIIVLVYLKIKRCSPKSDIKQQQENIQTEEWTCVKTITETKKTVQEDEKSEVGYNTR